METDREILEQHLNNLYRTSKDGDKVVQALRRMLQSFDDKIKISTDIDLMIAVDESQVRIYQHGIQIDKIKSAKFEYDINETSQIEIKQYI